MTVSLKSWGGCSARPTSIVTPHAPQDLDLTTPYLAVGSQRSYGDSALVGSGRAIRMTEYNDVISFDQTTGILRCQAGITLQALIAYAAPLGWLPPVLPGTQFVTIGGAIANDIHGKNHHRNGSFGTHVTHLKIARSDGDFDCSPTENAELFNATIGGLGLTGVVLEAAFRMMRVNSSIIIRNRTEFSSVAEMLDLLREADKTHDYTVAWLDLSRIQGEDFAGYVDRANHSTTPSSDSTNLFPRFVLSVPATLPFSVINPLSVRIFNTLYRIASRQQTGAKEIPLEKFFFPLDRLRNWNRLYGRHGFLQFQGVIPNELSAELQRHILLKLLMTVAENSLGTPLVVIKNFSSITSPGLLSYPRAGLNIALDMIPSSAAKVAYHQMTKIVSHSGGAIYPAKDALMTPDIFHTAYQNLDAFRRHIDPNATSLFWDRMQYQ